jgi:hypothetical protein
MHHLLIQSFMFSLYLVKGHRIDIILEINMINNKKKFVEISEGYFQ